MTRDPSAAGSDASRAAESAPFPAADVRDALAYDRTHLANERTFAAWLRTGLSVAAGGIAVAHVVPEPARDSWIALLLGAVFVLIGVAVVAYGAREFARVSAELARDSGRRSPVPTRAVFALTALIGVLLLAVLLFLWSHRGTVRAEASGADARGPDRRRVTYLTGARPTGRQPVPGSPGRAVAGG